MAMLGQGLVLMIAGMTIVYLFLWVMIIICKHASIFVSRFSNIIPDDEPKKRSAPAAVVQSAEPSAAVSPDVPADGEEVKAPVPGTVLRITAQDGQTVEKDDELLVMDVMKMETPITAPRSGCVSIRVAAMDKVSTGDVLAIIS